MKGLLRMAHDDVEQGLARVESALREVQAHDMTDEGQVELALGAVNLLRTSCDLVFAVEGSEQPARDLPGRRSEALTRPLRSLSETSVMP